MDTNVKLTGVALVTLLVLGTLAPQIAVMPAFAAAGNTGEFTVETCTTISEPGTYVLAGNISTSVPAGDECIEVTASDVALDGRNKTIDLSGDGAAVNVTSQESITNVTVANINVQGGGTGITVYAPADSTDVGVALVDNVVSGTVKGSNVTADGNQSSLEIVMHGNRITDASGAGIDIDADGPDSATVVDIEDNTVDTSSDAIDDIEADGLNSSVAVSIVGNSVTTQGSEWDGIDDIDAGDDNQTVEVTISDNNFDPGDDWIDDIDVDGEGTTSTVSIVDNSVVAVDDGIDDIEADGQGSTATVTIVGNAVTAQSSTGDAIDDIDAYADNQTVDVTIVNNHFEPGDDGIEDIDVDGEGTVAAVSILDNTIIAGEEGIDDIDAYADDQNVRIEIANNQITAADEALEDIEVHGHGSTVELGIVGNTFDTPQIAIDDIDAYGDNSNITATIARNTMSVGESGIEDFDMDGSNQTITASILGNRITGFSQYGIDFDQAAIVGAHRFDVHVVGNTIRAGSGEAPVGIQVDPVSGSGTEPTTLVAEHNLIEAASAAVRVDSGPVVGMRFRHNVLDGNHYGVQSLNTTAGTYVNAVGNYWTTADGPGSAGPYADPVTGALANGTGTTVSNANETLANVHFDPFLSEAPQPRFAVAIGSADAQTIAGRELTVDAEVENLGAGADRTTKTLELVVNGTVRDTASVTAIPGVPTSGALTWNTSPGDAGNYTATVRSPDDSSTTGITVIPVDGSFEGTDGTSGGGQEGETTDGDQDDTQDGEEKQEAGDQDETITAVQTSQEGSQTQTTATVQNAPAGQPVTMDVGPEADAGTDGVQLTSVSVTPSIDSTFTIDITESPEPLDTSPTFQLGDGTTPVSYLSVQHSLPNADIEAVTMTYRVPTSTLESMSSNPEAVSMFRYNGEAWVEQPTQVVGVQDGVATIQTTAEDLSEWTAAAKRPLLNVTDTQVSVQAATTDELVTIQVFVQNTGGTDGVYEAELLLNDETVDRTERTVPDGGTVAVNFERTFGQPGLYTVEVNDVFVGEVNISAADETVEVDTEGAGEVQSQQSGNESESDGGGSGFPVLPVGIALVVVAGVGVWVYLTRVGE